MGKKLLIFVGLAMIGSTTLVSGITLTSRRFPSCVYVGGKIYCYGGFTSVLNSATVDDNLYSLDINQFSGKTIDSLNDKWEHVEPGTPFNTESRRIPTAIVLPDGRRFLLQGGYTKGTKFVNQTIIYDTTTNSWHTTSPYTEPNRGIRQIYSATGVNLPNNLIGFYGGFEQFANTAVPQTTASGATMPYYSNGITSVGFGSMQMYSSDTASWATFSPQQSNLPVDHYFQSQTATLDPTSGKVFYLGGTFSTPTQDDVKAAFGWSYTFNTKSGVWSNETFKGVVPTVRIGHTAHLLPNSRNIVLYGGTGGTDQDGKASVDYCYTLNVVDNTWTEQSNLNVPSILSGPRFLHSSVLVNTTLFIFFGKGLDGTMQPSMLSIDVADVANISYKAVADGQSGNTSFPIDDNTGGFPSGLSKGAIGGIAAGAVVAVLAIIAVIVLCLRKKRKSEKGNASENQDQYAVEQIHVDWDKIDDQYRDTPTPVGSNFTNSPYSAHTTKGSMSPGKTPNLNANNVSVVKPSVDIIDTNYPLNKPNAI